MVRIRSVLVVGVIVLAAAAAVSVYRTMPWDQWLADLMVGLAGVGVCIGLWRRSAVTATAALVLATTWFAGTVWSWPLYWHRAPLMFLVLAAPARWPRTHTARVVIAAGCVAAIAGSLWQREPIAVGLATVVVVAALVESHSDRSGRVLAAVTFAGAVYAGLLIPHLGAATWTPQAAVFVYELLLVAVVVLTWRRTRAPGLLELTDLAVSLPPAPVQDAARLAALVNNEPGLVADRDLQSALGAALQLHRGNERVRADVRDALAEASDARHRLVVAEAAERARLAAELGDAAERPLADLVDRAARLGVAEAALRRAAASLAAAVGGLRPPSLEEGIARALRTMPLAKRLEVELDLDDERCDDVVEDALFAVAAEALANVSKHAGPCRVTIVYGVTDGIARIEVADDGSGGATLVRGRGLAGLDDRFAALGGTLAVASTERVGTVVTATVPASAREAVHCPPSDLGTPAGSRTPATVSTA